VIGACTYRARCDSSPSWFLRGTYNIYLVSLTAWSEYLRSESDGFCRRVPSRKSEYEALS